MPFLFMGLEVMVFLSIITLAIMCQSLDMADRYRIKALHPLNSYYPTLTLTSDREFEKSGEDAKVQAM